MAVTFGFGFLVLATTLLVVIIKTWAANARAKAEIARDDAFRKLAESYDSLLQRTAVSQRSTSEELVQIRAKVEAMEHLMRTVE